MNDEILILALLKKLGFEIKESGDGFAEFEKLDSPLKIKLTKSCEGERAIIGRTNG